MTMSSLANMGFMDATHHSYGRSGYNICKFTPHYMAGNLTLEQCVGCWVNRDASSNYGIDSDGNIACFVEEENRAWTSSSADNDNQAITVEVANLENETGRITDAAWQSLVRLATDICHRYNFRLNFTGDPSGSLTMHKMFAATACPGPWIESHMSELAQTVNNNLDTGNFSYSGTASGTTSGPTTGISTVGGMTGGTIVVNDPAIAYAAGIEGQILFDQEEIYPFVITIDGNTQTELDFDKLKEFDVIGVCIDIGSYFTESHTINKGFRNSKLDEQFNAVKEAGLAIGIMTTLRSRNEEEALKELYEIRLASRRYRPDIGLWLIPTFYSNDKEYNDELVKVYYDYLIKLGFMDQVGFYCKKDEMEKFNWEDVCEDWYWWMDRHLSNVDNIHDMPTPKFFMYDDPADEDGLIKPDFEGWHSLRASARPFGAGGLISGSGGYTDYQKAVSDAAESGDGCNTTAGWCAQFVTDVFTQARKVKSDIQVPYGNAIDYWTKWSSSGGTGKDAPVGSVVVGSGTAYKTDGTNPFGHVGVVLTEGRVADNWGYHRISDSVDAWASGQNAPCGSYVGYIGWVWANGQDLSKMGTMIGGQTDAVPGTLSDSFDVPSGLGTYCTYEKGDINWASGTYQQKLFAKNPSYDSNGFYFYNGRYVIAMTLTFGYAGTMVDIYFHNDKVLKCIIGDTKSSGDPGCTEWGHDYGRNMVEFIIKSDVTPSGASNSWYPSPPGCQGWLTNWWNDQGFNSGVAKVNIMGSVL